MIDGQMKTIRSRVRFLASLLCMGVKPTQNALSELKNFFGYDAGFIHGAVLMLEGNRPLNTAIFEKYLDRVDGPILDYFDGIFSVKFEDHCEQVEPLSQPNALNGTIPGFGNRSQLAKLHSPSTLFLTPIRECIFAVQNEICQFCNFNGEKMTAATPSEIALVVKELSQEIGTGFDIAIGSGTPNLNDGGARYFSNIVQEIRRIHEFPVSVEMIPPTNISDIEILKESGVSSIISSIEIWSDCQRSKLLPGKSKISKQRYQDWWAASIEALGRGQVSSVLIAGLDDPNATKQGIDELVGMGVIPTIIPFRPYDGIPLEHELPCGVELYVELVRHNTNALFEAGLTPLMQSGCTKCQGCSIDDPVEALTSSPTKTVH